MGMELFVLFYLSLLHKIGSCSTHMKTKVSVYNVHVHRDFRVKICVKKCALNTGEYGNTDQCKFAIIYCL